MAHTEHRLSPAAVEELIDTLRYLDHEFMRFGLIDATNMRHVTAALALVDFARADTAPPGARSTGCGVTAMACIPNPRFTRFVSEVDCQLESLGYESAWPCEVRMYFDDGMSVNEAATALIEKRDYERGLIDTNREHSTLNHPQQGL